MPTVTVDMIKKVKPGKPKAFSIKHPKEIKSIRTLCSYVGINYPELGLRYSANQNEDRSAVIISAFER